jgi:hypothetical protein
MLQVCFVDLRPVPPEASPLSAEGFAVLVGVLLASSHLDARVLAEAVDDVDVATKVCAKRWGHVQASMAGRTVATYGPWPGDVLPTARSSNAVFDFVLVPDTKAAAHTGTHVRLSCM